MVKWYLTIAYALLLAGCKEPDIETMAREEVLVNAFIATGEPVRNIYVGRIEGLNGTVTATPIATAQVVLSGPAGEVTLIPDQDRPGFYVDASNSFAIEAEATYQLTVEIGEKVVSAETQVPPATLIVNVSATDIPVDENSSGQPVFSLLWEQLTGYSHVLTLSVPEDPTVIPFDVPSGLFQTQYKLPVPSQGVTLYDVDFMYYGSHELVVYTIDSQYEDIYYSSFNTDNQLVSNVGDNIEGGTGVFAAASVWKTNLNILEN